MTSKQTSFIPIWDKYLPAIRILVKKSATEEQSLGMNRTDFERAVGIKKSGYRFVVNFIDSRPDSFFSNNDIAQAFISVLTNDEGVKASLLKNNYSFTFTSKYQLQIKNTGLTTQAESPLPEAENEHEMQMDS